MSIQEVETIEDVNAIPDPKFVVWRRRRGYLVATGADIPQENVTNAVVSLWAFKESLRGWPGNQLTAAETAVAGMSVRRQLLWATTAVIGRSWGLTTAIRNNTTLNNSDMDMIFRNASLLDPASV